MKNLSFILKSCIELINTHDHPLWIEGTNEKYLNKQKIFLLFFLLKIELAIKNQEGDIN